jgi:ribosomal protein S18 acetylase RimI-like enzyme
MTQTIIRFGEPADIDAISQFNIAMAMETEGKELCPSVARRGVQMLFERPQYGFYVVARTDGEPVGCLMITYEWSDWRAGVFWWIQSLYVKQTRRKEGVFRQMHRFLKAQAMERGDVCGFRLYVEKSNDIAISTYQKLGLGEVHYRVYEQLF